MIYLFIMLIVLGLLQCYNLFILYQRTKILRKAELIGLVRDRKGPVDFMMLFPRLYSFLVDLKFHLIGKKRTIWLKNGVICIVMQIIAFYINHEFLHISPMIMAISCFFVTIMGVFVHNKKKFRVAFETDFAEALNIINSAIRANNTILRGISECGNKLEGELGGEFSNIAQRLDIGESPETVFADSFERFPFKEYYFFILTVQLNMKGGGQVKEIMNKLTSLISNGRVMERKKFAMTSEVRMSIKILAAIPIGFIGFIKLTSPENFAILLYNPMGQIIFYYSIGSILTGLFIVWLMMNKI